MKRKSELHIYRQGRGELTHWYYKPRYKGERQSFDLGTHVEVLAQRKAKEIFHHLRGNGWTETLKKYKPESVVVTGPILTVGEFLSAVERIYTGKRTSFTEYSQHLRRVAADLAKLPRLNTSSEAHNAPLRARIDAVPLSIFTRAKMQAWVISYLAQGDPSPVAQQRRKMRANAYLNHIGSLFGAGRLEALGLSMEDPTDRIKRFPEPDCRFVPKVDIHELFAKAMRLKNQEMVKAFVLMLCGGLRRAEADCLLWEQVLFDANMIEIKTTKYFQPKVFTAAGRVPIDAEIMQLLRGWRAQDPEAEFVLAGGKVRLNHKRAWYRANKTFERLKHWLQLNGISDPKPIHHLRKACGSLVNERGGIYQAKEMLRHSRIRTTESHYVTKGSNTTVGLSVSGQPKVVPGKFKAA